MNRHNHLPACEHSNLKFCKQCKVPYCVDCGYEWNSSNYWQYPFSYTLNGLTYVKSMYQGQGTAGQSPDVVKLSETVCTGGHKG